MIWHNANELPMEGDNLLLKISYEDYEGSSDYVISGYYENGWWYKFDGCAQRISSSEYVTKWAYEDDIDNPWHTGTPTESGEYLVCIRYDFGKEGYTTADYVEPYNPHTGWYNLKPPSVEDGNEWCKKNGIEVIAWQKIEPYKETD